MAQCARKTSGRYSIFFYWEGDRKKCKRHRKSFQNLTRGRLLETLKTLLQRFLLLETFENGFYVTILHVVLKSRIKVFAFLYVEVNSKKICEEISFPSFFRKILSSVYLLRFQVNYLENAWLLVFFFVDYTGMYQ